MVKLDIFCGGIFLTVGLMITFSLPQPQYFGHWWEGRHLFHPEKSYMLYKKFENKKDCTNGWIGDTDPSAPRNMVSRLSYMLVQGWGQNHLQLNLGAFGVNHCSAPASQPTKVCLMVQNLRLFLRNIFLVNFTNPDWPTRRFVCLAPF